MNINNLLKTGMLACAIIFSINSNANATENENNKELQARIEYQKVNGKVNSKVFQHNVVINNGKDIEFIAYYYSVPKKKHYVMNPDNGCFKEMHNDNLSISDNNVYIAYADNHDEYNHNKYNCTIQYDDYYELTDAVDTNNKFNELYKRKITGNLMGDAKTHFANAVHKLFGNDYEVIENEAEDFGRVLAQYPGNHIQAYMEDLTQKDLIKIFPTYKYEYTFDEINDLLIHNGFDLVKQIEEYSWDKGIVVKNENNEEKKLNMPYFSYSALIIDQISLSRLNMRIIIITNGCDVIVFNSEEKKINVYKNLYARNESKLKSSNDLIDKLNKAGLVLQEAYKKEIAMVKEVFGQDFGLSYE